MVWMVLKLFTLEHFEVAKPKLNVDGIGNDHFGSFHKRTLIC